MSKLRGRWLWAIVATELLIIAGLLVWGLVIREPEKSQAPSTENQQSSAQLKEPKVELKKLAEGFDQPTAIVALSDPADKRLFIVEQSGTIRTATTTGDVAPQPLLDISSRVQTSGEMGLLGMTFHPKAAQNNYFYVNYVDKNRNTIIARFTMQGEAADPASEKVLLKIKQPFANHNGGQLAFGPDGYLYIGLGDGGSSGDPNNRSQNKDDLLGKILRIDVDQGDPYGIPADNPFADGGGRGEVWALGLRNPWRFSFDQKTGNLFIADVGQGEWEEVSLQSATSKGGENYGWRCFEGEHAYRNAACPEQPLVYPIIEYGHDEGRCSITGGYMYRGSVYPALQGSYFYGDYCNGQIFSAKPAGTKWQTSLAVNSPLKISTFGQDSSGELYVADHTTGAIYQITDTAND